MTDACCRTRVRVRVTRGVRVTGVRVRVTGVWVRVRDQGGWVYSASTSPYTYLSGVHGVVQEDHHAEDDILVEEVVEHASDPRVVPKAMYQQQRFQETELGDRKV